MSYTKQNFSDGQTLHASQLNAMDEQIAKNEREVLICNVEAYNTVLQLFYNGERVNANWIWENIAAGKTLLCNHGAQYSLITGVAGNGSLVLGVPESVYCYKGAAEPS
jgi:hypothetical protein